MKTNKNSWKQRIKNNFQSSLEKTVDNYAAQQHKKRAIAYAAKYVCIHSVS